VSCRARRFSSGRDAARCSRVRERTNSHTASPESSRRTRRPAAESAPRASARASASRTAPPERSPKTSAERRSASSNVRSAGRWRGPRGARAGRGKGQEARVGPPRGRAGAREAPVEVGVDDELALPEERTRISTSCSRRETRGPATPGCRGDEPRQLLGEVFPPESPGRRRGDLPLREGARVHGGRERSSSGASASFGSARGPPAGRARPPRRRRSGATRRP